jgi:hypothetical protein
VAQNTFTWNMLFTLFWWKDSPRVELFLKNWRFSGSIKTSCIKFGYFRYYRNFWYGISISFFAFISANKQFRAWISIICDILQGKSLGNFWIWLVYVEVSKLWQWHSRTLHYAAHCSLLRFSLYHHLKMS